MQAATKSSESESYKSESSGTENSKETSAQKPQE